MHHQIVNSLYKGRRGRLLCLKMFPGLFTQLLFEMLKRKTEFINYNCSCREITF